MARFLAEAGWGLMVTLKEPLTLLGGEDREGKHSSGAASE